MSAATVIDLPSLATMALAAVEPDLPEAVHLVYERRSEMAYAYLADRAVGAYGSQIMDAIAIAAGPCPCTRCVAMQGATPIAPLSVSGE